MLQEVDEDLEDFCQLGMVLGGGLPKGAMWAPGLEIATSW